MFWSIFCWICCIFGAFKADFFFCKKPYISRLCCIKIRTLLSGHANGNAWKIKKTKEKAVGNGPIDQNLNTVFLEWFNYFNLNSDFFKQITICVQIHKSSQKIGFAGFRTRTKRPTSQMNYWNKPSQLPNSYFYVIFWMH